MKKRIINFLRNCFFRIISAKDLISLIENEKIKECISQVTIGNNSSFYSEAFVENIDKNKEKIVIGAGTHIRGELTAYAYAQQLAVGNNCYIGKYSVIRAGERIIIGDNVLIAHGVTIIDSNSHEMDPIVRASSFCNMVNTGHSLDKGAIDTAPIIIGDYVWISYGVCVLKGVSIGTGAIIGAGSVVTKDIPSWTLAAGNPARVIKELEKPKSLP